MNMSSSPHVDSNKEMELVTALVKN